MTYLVYFALICVAIFFLNKFLTKFKFPKCGAIAVFTGGVKVGKSAVSLAFALSNYRRIHRIWKVKCFFRKFANLFRKNKKPMFEEPFFYSSIKLANINYVPLTREHLLRKKRLHFGSVCFIDEASLVADSMLYKDTYINNELLLFCKLFGHSTHGGKLVFNSHCIGDLHFALRRCTSEYFHIHHISKYIPFLTLVNMREERFSEDNGVVNNYNEDVEESLKKVLMRKRVFKFYDCFCFSSFTDDLETDSVNDMKRFSKFDSLKMDKIVSFNPVFFNLGDKDEKKNS